MCVFAAVCLHVAGGSCVCCHQHMLTIAGIGTGRDHAFADISILITTCWHQHYGGVMCLLASAC